MHIAYINSRPKELKGNVIPTGAINGNGDVGIVLGDIENGVRVNIAKCDFWKGLPGKDYDGGIKQIGFVDITGIDTSVYHIEEDLDRGELRGKFQNAEAEIFVSACENILLIRIVQNNSDTVKVKLSAKEGSSSENTESEKGDCFYVTRSFRGEKLLYETDAAAVIRQLSSKSAEKDMTEYIYAVSVVTNHDCENYLERALEMAENAEFEAIREKHLKAWSDFWSKSSVKLYDKEIENNWYAGLYVMRCCAGNRKFPPGLYGNFITRDDMSWHGDYHLNYNYEAPFYALCSSNHVELTECYFTPLEDFEEKARSFAKEYLSCRGVYYPVSIEPKGVSPALLAENKRESEVHYLGQKSNAAYAAVVPIMIWYATNDEKKAREHIYPFINEVAEFWEDYLKFEDGRYVIYNDAIHEVPFYRDDFKDGGRDDNSDDFNNLLSLGLVRMVFKAALDISAALGLDADKAEKREHILAHISDYPTFHRRFKKVFRYTERGMKWNDTNSLCIQHIYPAGQIDFLSDEKLLKIARDTYFLNDRRLDENGACSYLPCGARIGVSPSFLTDALKLFYKKKLLPNMLFNCGGGCIENNSTTVSTVNEMLLQCRGGIMRIFPCWDKSKDAEFDQLRADGAFLVSASVKNGEMGKIMIVSEKGNKLKIMNPFGAPMAVKRGNTESIFNAEIFETETNENETIIIEKAKN
ncbi:MAG: hypothetical protein K6F09_07250 [Clostridiales bacterium]|nr:hypothetical protein [Clostridiales bacterium]